MKQHPFSSVTILLLLFFLFACTKEKTFPWRDEYVYSHELTGTFYRKWKMNFMTTYIYKNGKMDSAIQRNTFGPGNTIQFYADKSVVLGDSISIRTYQPSVTKWIKGSDEPFHLFFMGDQLWFFTRYYPVPAFDDEMIILSAGSYKLPDGRAAIYEMCFTLAGR